MTDPRPLPDPGSDEARAGIANGYEHDCDCSPTDNGVTHPTMPDDPGPDDGKAVKPPGGWVISPMCRMHGPGAGAPAAIGTGGPLVHRATMLTPAGAA